MRKFASGAVAATLLFALAVAGPAFATDDNASSSTTTKNTATTPSTDAPSPTPAPTPAPKGKLHMSSNPDSMFGGFSLGASFGYVQSNGDTTAIPLPNAEEFFNLEQQTLIVHPHGVIGGLRAGYDVQHGMWDFGLLVDFSGSGLTANAVESPIIQTNGTPFPGSGFLSAKEETKWLSTIRPRVGFVVDKRVLFYATGGFVFGRVTYAADTDFLPSGDEIYQTEFNRIRGGWTVGAGVQYAIHRHWNAGAEYLYYEFSNVGKAVNGSPLDPPFQVAYVWAASGNIAQAVLNYRF